MEFKVHRRQRRVGAREVCRRFTNLGGRKRFATAELESGYGLGRPLGTLSGDSARSLLGGSGPHSYFVERLQTPKRVSESARDCRSMAAQLKPGDSVNTL